MKTLKHKNKNELSNSSNELDEQTIEFFKRIEEILA